MGNYNKDNRSGGRSFGGGGNRGGGRGGYGGRDEGRPQMHEATCSECGQECEVPFKPTGDKPVFCRDCFRNKGDSGQGRSGSRFSDRFSGRSGGRSDDRPSFEEKKMYKVTCDKCGDECEVPFQPTGGKPIYCSKCFDKGDRGNKGNRGGNSGSDFIQFKEQFEMLNIKLDRLIKALMPAPSHVELVKQTPKVSTPAPTPKAKKAVKKAKAKKVSAKKKK